MEKNDLFPIEVAYGTKDNQVIIQLMASLLMTVEEAIIKSNILTQFPEINLKKQKVGIFSQPVNLTDKILKPHDRIELYRSLLMDPKAARLQRRDKNK